MSRLIAEKICINAVRPRATSEEILKMLDAALGMMKENHRINPKLKYTVNLLIEEI